MCICKYAHFLKKIVKTKFYSKNFSTSHFESIQGVPIVSRLFCGKHSHRIALNCQRDSQTWVWLLWVNISRMRWSIWACEHSVGKLTSAATRKS